MKQITVDQATELLAHKNITVFDMRDEGSFSASHIDGALRLTQTNLMNYIRDRDMSQPILVYCYHGISSQATAEFLSDQGFQEVYSLIGGYEAWRTKSATTDHKDDRSS